MAQTTAIPRSVLSKTTRPADKNAIRPFQVPTVPEAELVELRRRINATRFPERETVTDASQGVQLATMERLARYWATEYDWRQCEARLQALPHFVTEIDGLDIHFVHVRSKHANALPVIVTRLPMRVRYGFGHRARIPRSRVLRVTRSADPRVPR